MKSGGARFPDNNISGSLAPNEEYTATIVFCPSSVGNFTYKIPVILNDNVDLPYRLVELKAYIGTPKLFYVIIIKPESL